MQSPLPADVTALLDRLTSVMQLEVLLTLHQSEEPCTTTTLIRRLGGSTGQMGDCLAGLVAQGLATSDAIGTSFSYRPGDDDTAVDHLAAIHASHRVRIISFLLRDRLEPGAPDT